MIECEHVFIDREPDWYINDEYVIVIKYTDEYEPEAELTIYSHSQYEDCKKATIEMFTDDVINSLFNRQGAAKMIKLKQANDYYGFRDLCRNNNINIYKYKRIK